MIAISDLTANKTNSFEVQDFSNNLSSVQNSFSKNETSFIDFVNSYQNSNETQKTENSQNQTEVTEKKSKEENGEIAKNDDKTSKIEKKSETQDEVKTENSKVEEKIENLEDKKSSKTENKSDEKNLTKVKNEEKENEKINLKSQKKVDKEENQSKIEEKDLSRFENLTSSFVKNQTENQENLKNKKNDDFAETKSVENFIEIEKNENLTLKNDNFETKDFNFGENKEKSQNKELKFDKEGKIQVQDLRTQKSDEIEAKVEPKLKTTVKQTSENTATLTMNCVSQEANSDILSLNNQTASANGSNFQSMLNNQIQQNIPEFVKAGNIVLKDNNQGSINLILHPDDLGNVKIHLTLDGKNLSGHISVATKEALEVFKDNSETLREAFIKNGFESANFDVSYGNGGGANQNFNFEQKNEGTSYFVKQIYENDKNAFSNESAILGEKVTNFGNYSVNIVA